MNDQIAGIHHITAITSDAQKNIDFYTRILGLKFIKLTVNFDDPSSYHLYYGDKVGSPGTALTFFVWPGGHRGRVGVNQAMAVAFSIPESSMAFWIERFISRSVMFEKKSKGRFGDNFLSFKDPDGMLLELVADKSTVNPKAFAGYGVPQEHAIRGFHSVTLLEDGFEDTDAFLRSILGFQQKAQDDTTVRYTIPRSSNEVGSSLDVRSVPDFLRGEMGTGVIHHVAFRVANDEVQDRWHKMLMGKGANVSPVIDRKYFHSIYFHEPGGVLFEIATDGPGFTIDEPEKELGTGLKLPPAYEAHRSEIEKILPSVVLPSNE